MSVLIKKMEMPSSCWECKFCIYNDRTCLPHSCVIEMSVLDHFDIANGKPNWCPLVEVPPHERLIDADELLRNYQDSLCANVECELCPFCEKPNGWITVTFCMVEEWIKNAPTVIEREE